jgi:hypothetical protein
MTESKTSARYRIECRGWCASRERPLSKTILSLRKVGGGGIGKAVPAHEGMTQGRKNFGLWVSPEPKA